MTRVARNKHIEVVVIRYDELLMDEAMDITEVNEWLEDHSYLLLGLRELRELSHWPGTIVSTSHVNDDDDTVLIVRTSRKS